MNNKEFKEYWSSKTLGELRGYIEERLRILQISKDAVKKEAQKILDLDETHKYYSSVLTESAGKIKSYTKDIKEDEKRLGILNPILEQKELEGIDQAEYEKYMADNNDNIRILIKKVEAMKEENREWFKTEMNMSDKDINELHDLTLKELIWMLKDNVGNIVEVKYLKYNSNKGFDGQIEGEKGTVNINTIGAGGYNVQKFHYRTLIHQY